MKSAVPLIVFGAIVVITAFVPTQIREHYELSKNSLDDEDEDVTDSVVEESEKIVEVFDAVGNIRNLHDELQPNHSNNAQQDFVKQPRTAELPAKHRPRFGG